MRSLFTFSHLLVGLVLLLRFFAAAAGAARKVVSLELSERDQSKIAPARERRLRKRQNTVSNGFQTSDITWEPDHSQFYVEVEIGDNEQKVKLAVVQHPLTWVATTYPATSCNDNVNECAALLYAGLYEPGIPGVTDANYTNLTTAFNFEYDDKKSAKGWWGRNSFRLGQLFVDGVNYGVTNQFTTSPALGLETAKLYPQSVSPYPSFIEVMMAADMINTLAYSIYVGDLRAKENTGKSLVFGGIDEAKFKGPMKTYDSATNNRIQILGINLRSDNATADSVLKVASDSTDVPVAMLDLGTADIQVPRNIYREIISGFKAERANNYQIRGVPPDTWGLEFLLPENLKIFVPLSQMIRPVPDDEDWYEILIVENSEENTFTLGSPFYRGAYIVHDFTNDEISIAQAILNASSTANIIEIGINGSSVRDIDFNTTSTSTNIDTFDASPSDTDSQNMETMPPKEDSKSKAGPIAGGVIGIFVVIALVVGVFFYMRRWKIKHAPLVIPPPPTQGYMGDGFYSNKPELPSAEEPLMPPPMTPPPRFEPSPEPAMLFSPVMSGDNGSSQRIFARPTSEERARALELP